MDTTPLGYEQVEYRAILRSNEEFGIPIDGKAARQFAALDKQQRELLREAIVDLTKGRVATVDERDKILAFLRSRNCAIPNLQKGTVARWLRRSDLHAEARKLLELRAASAHKPKVDGILRNVDPDTSRIFHSMTYANAGTGRLSSHSPNMQNLHREEGDTAGKFAAIMSGDIARIQAFGPVRQVLASCERALVAAEPGNQFFILDYSSIEYIIISWLAGEQWVLDAFAKLAATGNGDPYEAFGRECVGDVPWVRDFGKAVILPRIFGVGEERLREALLSRFPDLDPDIDVRRLIDLFDKRNPRIRNFWDEILACAIAAIKRPGQEIDCGRGASRIVFLFRDEFLTMRLPSGRYVSYPFARVTTREGRRGPEEALLFKENRKRKQKRSGSGADEDELHDDNDDGDEAGFNIDDGDGLDEEDGRSAFLDCQSVGQPGFWGGPLAENATQAVARDVMIDAVVRLIAADYRIVLTVHDEIVAEVPKGFGSFDEFVRLALEQPNWAPGMPVAGKSRRGPRLAKVDIPVEEWVTGDRSHIPLHKVTAPRKAAGERKPKRSKPASAPRREESPVVGEASAPEPVVAAGEKTEAADASSEREEPTGFKAEADATGGEANDSKPTDTGAAEESPDKASGGSGDAYGGNGSAPDWLRERLRREQQEQKAKSEDKAEDRSGGNAPPPPPPPPPPGGDEFEDENEDGYPSWRRRSQQHQRSEAENESDPQDLPHPEQPAGDSEAPKADDPKGPYVYENARGRFYICVERKYNSKGEKYFPQWHWEEKWVKGTKGLLKIPYRLPELLAAPPEEWVLICAGEKDVLTAVRLGFVATTNPGGEGKGQFTPELPMWFAGKKRVAVMEDNDKTGYAHALEVAKPLRGIVPDIRIVSFRELSEHGDLTDWVEADPTRRGHAELLARIEAAKPASSYELLKVSDITPRVINWHWPGHLACGELAILTGAPDLGKSQLHCFMVATVTTGRDWPDGAKGPARRKVVMLTAEDNNAHTMRPRLFAAGADLDRVFILNRIHKDNKDRTFLLQEDLDVLEEILRNDPEIGLVTFDPITAFMGGKIDSHRATDVRSQLTPLHDLAERTGVAFSAITHPGKKPGPKAIDHYIGSQAYIAAPRVGDMCQQELDEDGKPTGRFLFLNAKHNVFRGRPTLVYRLVQASGGFDPIAKEEIVVSRVEWCGEVDITADQAVAAARAADKGKAASGAVTFLLDTVAAGPVLRSTIMERGKTRSFSEDQLRRARKKAGIIALKAPGHLEGAWWWMKPEQEQAWRETCKQSSEETPPSTAETPPTAETPSTAEEPPTAE
jgi:hypothetical protein